MKLGGVVRNIKQNPGVQQQSFTLKFNPPAGGVGCFIVYIPRLSLRNRGLFTLNSYRSFSADPKYTNSSQFSPLPSYFFRYSQSTLIQVCLLLLQSTECPVYKNHSYIAHHPLINRLHIVPCQLTIYSC